MEQSFHPFSDRTLYHLETAEFNSNVGCMEMKRKALLSIKEGLRDPFGRLSSWIGEDCCNLAGVGCSNQTGHIVDHRNKYDCPSDGGNSAPPNRFYQLGGTLNPSLLNLTHLNYLDVSDNDFLGIPIPDFLGSLKNLKYLNLNWANFSGMIPPHTLGICQP
ncbi:hypothetical protein SCA6_007657 [Theobroma cacao]